MAVVCSVVIPLILPEGASAQPRSRQGGLYGDWQVKLKYNEHEFESILAFSRNQEGQYTGQWISFWGVDELKDVKFEDHKLSFLQATPFRDAKFTGAIEQEELSGRLISNQGEVEIKGVRIPRIPRGVGSWEMKTKVGEREIPGTLTITVDKGGNLGGTWKNSRGESKISDVKYEDRKLTFTRVIQGEDNEQKMTFEGTLGYNSLEGVFKNDRGEAPSEGIRIGGALIGTWDLDIESERGPIKQRLRVNSDMSAFYGPALINKINHDGDKISFKYVLKLFSDREVEVSFEAKIADSKLTGEIKTSQGTWKVTGTRRPFRRPGSNSS